MTTKIQQALKQGITINSSCLTYGLFSHTRYEDPINSIIIFRKHDEDKIHIGDSKRE